MHYNMAAKVLPAHQPSLLYSAGLSHLTNSAMQETSQDKAQTPKVMSTRGVPRPPRTRPVPAGESFFSHTQSRTTDVSPSLSEVILERVTGRLRDRMRPESDTDELPKQLPSAIIPNTFQTICPSISDVPMQVPGQTEALPQVSVHPLSFGPTESSVLGQREEQQVHQQQCKPHTWEMEQMRQQKQYLQALIHSDAQVGDTCRLPILLMKSYKWIVWLFLFLFLVSADYRGRTWRAYVRKCWWDSSQFTSVFIESNWAEKWRNFITSKRRPIWRRWVITEIIHYYSFDFKVKKGVHLQDRPQSSLESCHITPCWKSPWV